MLTKIFGGKIVKVTEISWSANTQQKSSQYMEVVLLVALWHQMLVACDHNFDKLNRNKLIQYKSDRSKLATNNYLSLHIS